MRSRVTAVLVLAVLAASSGCDALDNARRAGSQGQLFTDLAARLGRGSELTYTAEYQLDGGRSATVAIAPGRAAYTFVGGKISVTTDTFMNCRRAGAATTCTLTSVPTAAPGQLVAYSLGADLQATIVASGFVPPSVVAGLLSAAALDPDATVRQHDSTIAGQHATCVEVGQVDNAVASAYDVCVTTDGVLGSFSGTVLDKAVEVSLTDYRDDVPDGAFAPPPGATTVDLRVSRQ
ncbi:MAG TPA: hypothetical protein VFC00_04600 [Micromonosporaceae bacterium]|nr:hypothetical protein [Micromonosporaceae bacterium]